MNFKRKIIEKLNDETVDIQERLFFMICIIGLTAYGMTCLVSILIGESPLNIVIMAVGFVALVSIVWLTFRLRKLRLGEFLISFLIVYVMLPLIFFTGGGIYGGASMWFIFAVLFVTMAIRGRVRLFFQISCAVIAGVCYFIAYTHPHTVTTHTLDMAYKDSLTQIIIIGVMVVILTSFTIHMYRSESKRSERQREEIDALNRAQNRFFSSMSHEIRTPINTIVGLNEMTLREDISDEIAENSRNIESASKLLLQLINDILDMSKLEAGEMKIIPAGYRLSEMISKLYGMFSIRTREKGLEFIVNVDPTIPSEYIGDEVRITQILINILGNAVKYTKEGSITLSIQCERSEASRGRLIFTVTDTGIGIKKESLPRLFSAFSRADEDENKYVEGTGLGLSIVKNLVDLMDGEITVNSIYTRGSTFMIAIPQDILDETEIGDIDLSYRSALYRRSDYHRTFEAPEARILIVDDNSANILVMKKLLRDTGVGMDTAQSGAEALKLTGMNFYDVIFMDHLMPEMDGVECMKRIRDQVGGMCKDSRIVALTANAGSDKQAYYMREGFDGYLLKPVTGADCEKLLLSMLPDRKVNLINADADLLVEHGEHIYARNKKKPLVITTESVCDLPKELTKKYDIPVIAYGVITEEGYFLDGDETDSTGVLDYMGDRGKLARSASPTVEQYASFFAEELLHANNVLHITMTSGLNSPSYMMASEAADTFDNVRVIDSRNFSSGMGLVVLEAVRLSSEGLSVDEVVSRLEEYMDRVRTGFVVDSLEYMTRAGRIPKIFSALTDAFMVHPALVLFKGRLMIKRVYFGTKRNTWKKFFITLLREAGHCGSGTIYISHADLTREDREYLRGIVEDTGYFDEIVFVKASASITANCGPGALGVAYVL